MNIINVNKKELVQAIEENCTEFGNPFLGLYVNTQGQIECTEKQNSGDLMPILTFSGMGGFTDENELHTDDKNYDAHGVAQYIVDEQECLTLNGQLLSDNGEEAQYKFKLV